MPSPKHIVNHLLPGFQKDHPGTSSNTIAQYKKDCERYIRVAKEEYKCHTVDEFSSHIQDYVFLLASKGRRPTTIYKYVSALCFGFEIPISSIMKPIRHCADITKSRGTKAVDKRADAQPEASPRLHKFADRVGIRRYEYLRLWKSDFVMDESGYPCVRVRKGKGKKFQLQRLLPKDVEFIAEYFQEDTDEYLFTKEEMNNKIDLHHLRAMQAQRAYQYYLHRLETEPGYRVQLTEEIKRRWEKYRGKPPRSAKKKYDWAWDEKRVQGTYRIRGRNREMAQANGLPVEYDRLAVMAVSVFHLSHWRCSVTVDNYLLAV